MSSTKALSAAGPDVPFVTATIERRDLRADDVLIDIAYAGICHSDIHQVKDEWGGSIYPMVPGHEIAGIVAGVGSGVTKYQVGDRVGAGYMVDSCGQCEYCLVGVEQFCRTGHVLTYNCVGYDGVVNYGGYSQQIVIRESFICRIPDTIELSAAASLFCAGITTYSPLRQWQVGSGRKIAVLGLGGLGHMGVKFAAAMGAEVTVLSRGTAKRERALSLGAKEFYDTSDPATFTELRGRFDLMLNTVSGELPLGDYLESLWVGGVLVTVGLPATPLSVPAEALVNGNRVLAGSLVGGIAQTQEMLDFCGEHGVVADVEVINADQVDIAYARVLIGSVGHRFVIDTATIGR